MKSMMIAQSKNKYTEKSIFNNIRFICCFLIIVIITTEGIKAQPDIAQKLIINEIVLYKDAKVFNLFYYLPGDLHIATDSDGKPDFKFLLMRYTGTSTSGDQGNKRFRNLLKMRIINTAPDKEVLDNIKQKLSQQYGYIRLNPIPVKNLKASILYSDLNENDSSETIHAYNDSQFNQEEDDNEKDEYWKERYFTVKLGNESAEAFWQSFNNQQTILSVVYAFYANVLNSNKEEINVSGSPEMKEKFDELFINENDSTNKDTILAERIIKASAFEVVIDTKKWPDLLTKVDINEQIPPDYAAIDIYCYDFNNLIRDDLYAKKIDIEAEGVGGNKVKMKYTFRNTLPDIYSYSINFPYAVRLDVPYKYRITEIYPNGSIERKEWVTSKSWHEILDITTQKEE